jgi:4-hydroxybenzoate polyprenyltransferase
MKNHPILNIYRKLIRISRFPHYLLSTGAFLLAGALLAVGSDAFRSPIVYVLFAWFLFPANLFLTALNDAFDYETDLHNPRKQSLESTVRKDGMAEMLWISFLALASALFILPYVSVLVRWLILLWALIVIVYNVPPFRFKRYPVLDILFSGVGEYIPIAVIGYTAVSGSLPPLPLVLLGIIFCTATHISNASFDAPYDRSAGIQNTTARLGSIKNGLMLSIFFYLASAVYAFFIGLPLFSVFVLVFPALIFYNIRKGDLEGRSVSIFKQLIWVPFVFGNIIGTLYYVFYFSLTF